MNAVKCELCRREALEGARLCVSCAEMVQRVAEASGAVTHSNEGGSAEGEAMRRKGERALAKAERLTPVILG